MSKKMDPAIKSLYAIDRALRGLKPHEKRANLAYFVAREAGLPWFANFRHFGNR